MFTLPCNLGLNYIFFHLAFYIYFLILFSSLFSSFLFISYINFLHVYISFIDFVFFFFSPFLQGFILASSLHYFSNMIISLVLFCIFPTIFFFNLCDCSLRLSCPSSLPFQTFRDNYIPF